MSWYRVTVQYNGTSTTDQVDHPMRLGTSSWRVLVNIPNLVVKGWIGTKLPHFNRLVIYIRQDLIDDAGSQT
jgi:hypothetical protein